MVGKEALQVDGKKVVTCLFAFFSVSQTRGYQQKKILIDCLALASVLFGGLFDRCSPSESSKLSNERTLRLVHAAKRRHKKRRKHLRENDIDEALRGYINGRKRTEHIINYLCSTAIAPALIHTGIHT